MDIVLELIHQNALDFIIKIMPCRQSFLNFSPKALYYVYFFDFNAAPIAAPITIPIAEPSAILPIATPIGIPKHIPIAMPLFIQWPSGYFPVFLISFCLCLTTNIATMPIRIKMIIGKIILVPILFNHKFFFGILV